MKLMVAAMNATVGNSARKLVLLKLADQANDAGECWPSFAHIAKHCEIGRSTAIEHVNALKEAGFLSVEKRVGPKGNSSNVYHLHIEKAGAQDVSPSPDSGLPPSPTVGLGSPNSGLPPSPDSGPRTSQSFEPISEPVGKRARESDPSAMFVMHSAWRPSDDALALIAKQIPHDSFAEDSIPEFVLYWRGRPNTRPAHQGDWDQRFMRHAKRQWERLRATVPAEPISPDFWPTDATVQDLALAGITQERLLGYVAEFRRYWLERNEIRHAWNAKFHQWALEKHASTPQSDRSFEERVTDRSWADDEEAA